MKLKIFDQKNIPVIPKGKPSIHVSRIGCITINMVAAQLLGLTDKHFVQLGQDQEEKTDWYLLASANTDGFSVRAKNKNGSFIFNNAKLTGLLLDSIQPSSKSLSIPLASVPEDYEGEKVYALLTKAIKKS